MQNQSNSERILLWKSSWNMFIDHPLTGIGTRNFKELYQTKYILPEAKEPYLGHAHNNFFQILAENGIFGLMSFIYLFGYILFRTWKSYKANNSAIMLAAFLATIGFLIHGSTEWSFDNPSVSRLLWLILSLAFAQQYEH